MEKFTMTTSATKPSYGIAMSGAALSHVAFASARVRDFGWAVQAVAGRTGATAVAGINCAPTGYLAWRPSSS